MADNLAVTPGAGASVCTDQVSDTSHAQIMKLAVSADADRTLIPADATYGMDVDVTRIAGPVPVTDNGGSLTIDATALPLPTGAAAEHVTAASPHAARLSDGAAFYDAAKTGQLPAALVSGRLDVNVGAASATVPVSDAGGSVTVDAPAATPVAVRVSNGSAFVDAIPVTDNGGSLTVDDGGGSLTVDGAVTANQGSAAAVASGWPVKVTDGADTVGLSTVSGAKALKVDVIQEANNPVKQDKAAFTEGTDKCSVVGGVYNETISSDPTEDQAAAARITAKRAVHVNLRVAAGTEIGTAGAPVRTDPTGSTTQPVSGTVAATQSGAWTQDLTKVNGAAVATAASGIAKVGLTDEAGAAFSQSNPLPVALVAQDDSAQWRAANTLGASETAVAIKTPSGGKTLMVCGLVITVTTTGAGAVIKVFDNSDAAANMLYRGTPVVGTTAIMFATPQKLSAANNVLRYSTGTNVAADLTTYGFEV